MKIICDTNIWYKLGQEESLFSKVKNEPIFPTYVNIYELSKSINVIKNESIVRSAIQKMFHFKSTVIYEPPFIYIPGLYQQIIYDPQAEIGTYLKFTELFASGDKIHDEKLDEFKAYSDKIREAFVQLSSFMNKIMDERKTSITNKKEHKTKNMFPLTSALLNFLIKRVSQDKYNLEDLSEEDFKKIELLLAVLGIYLNLIDRSTMKIKPNDWFDFLQLGYVQPGDKYWTEEKKWLNFIKDSGMGKYLYEPPS